MRFAKDLWREGMIALVVNGATSQNVHLYRVGNCDQSGPFSPVSVSYYDNVSECWKLHQTGLLQFNGGYTKQVFEEHEEVQAIAAMRTVMMHFDTRMRLIAASNQNIETFYRDDMSADDLRRHTNFMLAVVVHMEGEKSGLTDAFIDETHAALERLAVRVKLAEG